MPIVPIVVQKSLVGIFCQSSNTVKFKCYVRHGIEDLVNKANKISKEL